MDSIAREVSEVPGREGRVRPGPVEPPPRVVGGGGETSKRG